VSGFPVARDSFHGIQFTVSPAQFEFIGPIDMAIPTSCKCGFKFTAKDSLAGKRVKCPRCQGVIQVPTSAAVGAAVGGAAPAVNKKLLDLLDETGVKSTPRGPICAACGSEMDPSAVICIDCGYNVATGQYLETYTDDDLADQMGNSEMTDAEKALAKAEREIDDSPIGADEQDFGDGADAYIVAMAGFAVFAVLLLLGLGTVLIMESLTENVNTGLISAIAGTAIYLGCAIWIIMIAFKSSQSTHGMAGIFTLGMYCPVYGFMRGSGTIGVSAIMALAFVISLGSWVYCIASGTFSG